ncbi:MAG: DUF1064 domain-containing protein [Pseudomonadota bacterium]
MQFKHKFHAKPTNIDGIRFASKLEARYYSKLKAFQEAGELVFFLRQAPFHLPGNTRYVVDFVEFWKNGDITFTDCKGLETEVYKLKKRQVEELFPIKINVVKKA